MEPLLLILGILFWILKIALALVFGLFVFGVLAVIVMIAWEAINGRGFQFLLFLVELGEFVGRNRRRSNSCDETPE